MEIIASLPDTLGSYRIFKGETLGSGAQGSIVAGNHLETNQRVAIKVFDLTTEIGTGAFAIEYFIHKIMLNDSKRICKTIDCFQIPKKKGFLVMERYKQDLFDLAFSDNQEKLSMRSTRKIFKRICRGVRDLHQKGIAHLDLKPENVLMDENNNPVICDFGCSYVYKINAEPDSMGDNQLSKALRSTVIEALKGRGTRIYAAPEVFNSTEFNPFYADIYSLGILLHGLVTGMFPCTNNSSAINLSMARLKLNNKGFALLTTLLNENPQSRPNIEKVLTHSWFNTTSRRSKPKSKKKKKIESASPSYFKTV